MFNTLPHQIMLNTLPQRTAFDTLSQCQSTEGTWHQAGPEFQYGQSRFRTYGNTFDAGAVLPDYTGPRPTVAHMHTTTKYKPPDIYVDDNNAIPLRSVVLPSVEFTACLYRKARAGRRLERALGPGLAAPPRRAHLLGYNIGSKKVEGPEVTVNTGSTGNELSSPIGLPSTGVDQVSEPPENHKLTKTWFKF